MFSLTNEQTAIVSAIKNGENISVKAAPGSGKTSTIAYSLNAVSNRSAIALAYNRKAADDLVAKSNGYFATTFHAVGNALCWANRGRAFLRISEDKYDFILKPLLENYFLMSEKGYWLHRERLLEIFNMYRSYGDLTKSFEDIAEMFGFPMYPFYSEVLNEMLNRGIRSFTNPYKNNIYLDYTDTVFLPQKLGLEFKYGDKIGNKNYSTQFQDFDVIAADECNDLTYNYIYLIQILGRNAQKVAIGDPNQAINQWAGALDNSFEVIENLFQTERYNLSTVFRCPSNHVDYLNNEYSEFGELTAAKEEGILENIFEEDIPNYVDDNTAIIFRNQRGKKSPAWRVFINLLNADIPANIAGMGFKQIVKKIIRIATADSETKVKFEDLALQVHQAAIDNLNPKHSTFQDEKDEYVLTQALLEYAYNCGVKSFDAFNKFIQDHEQSSGPVLTTGHKTKGLEFNTTIVFPLPEIKRQTAGEAAAERRLKYVMDSRSMQNMYFVR